MNFYFRRLGPRELPGLHAEIIFETFLHEMIHIFNSIWCSLNLLVYLPIYSLWQVWMSCCTDTWKHNDYENGNERAYKILEIIPIPRPYAQSGRECYGEIVKEYSVILFVILVKFVWPKFHTAWVPEENYAKYLKNIVILIGNKTHKNERALRTTRKLCGHNSWSVNIKRN